ncbi:MAG: hypothetical protein HQ579_06835 [Candidatus Omnitrophica bacterium]|nr:hypothetical protein [Candidatus Omnitrophota bacterium]
MDLDILKLLVVLIAILYLNIRVRPKMSAVNYWIANAGLLLLLVASVLDFADAIRSLDNVPILGSKDPIHDLIEDQFADVPGLALFAIGTLREILRKK